MPATTPASSARLRRPCSGCESEPKRREFIAATGRAPIVKMSRRMPPTPVAAPWKGSMKEGWLCDSTLKAAHQPSPTSTIPAFSPGGTMTRSRSEEHTSELQSRQYLVCRLLLEKKKKKLRETYLITNANLTYYLYCLKKRSTSTTYRSI